MGRRKVLYHRFSASQHIHDALEINRSGQILGEYYTFDPATNETLAHNWFVYDHGNFIADFPESLEYIGGPAIYLADINDNGQIVGLRSNAGPDWNGVFLYMGGTFYDIELPAGWLVTEVRGINNKASSSERMRSKLASTRSMDPRSMSITAILRHPPLARSRANRVWVQQYH